MLIDKKYEEIYEFLLDKIKEKYIVESILMAAWQDDLKKKSIDIISDINDYYYYDNINGNKHTCRRGLGSNNYRINYLNDFPNPNTTFSVLHVNRLFKSNTIIFDDLDVSNYFIRTFIYIENTQYD